MIIFSTFDQSPNTNRALFLKVRACFYLAFNQQLITTSILALFLLTSCSETPKGESDMQKQSESTLALQNDASKVVRPPPFKPGQKLDPNSDYAKYWTGLPEWLQFQDIMTLRIPAEYTYFWTRNRYPKVKFTISEERPKHIREVDYLPFSMFMPDFGGFTPDNYMTQFNEDEIKIVNIQPRPMSYVEPDAPSTYPPNVFKRMLDIIDVNKYEEKYGLRCYDNKSIPARMSPRQICYGIRDQKLGEYIMIHLDVKPYGQFDFNPMMKTTYFTKQYGGLEITYWTHAKNFNRWQEIDRQIWQHIADWNVANQKPIVQIISK